jgi:hypothetical protein
MPPRSRTPDKPLISAKEESYAQERAYGYRQREAARRAGLDDYTGIFAKYEKKPRVQNRISYLRKDDLTNEFHQEKRRHLEQRLELVAFGSMFEFVTIDPVSNRPRVDWKALAESDLGQTIAELRFDKDTGSVVHLSRDSALQAINQLREMRGYKAADRHLLGIAEVTQLSDEELLKIANGNTVIDAKVIDAKTLPPPRAEIGDDDIEDVDVDEGDGGVGSQEA